MKTFLLLMSVAACTAFPALAQPGLLISHEFVIRVESTHDLHDILEEHNLVVIEEYAPQGLYLVGPGLSLPDRGDDETESELHSDNRVLFSEQNRQNYSEDGHTQSFFVRTASSEFPNQSAFSHIGLKYSPPQWNGQGVTVAILDTGVSAHSMLSTSLRGDGANFVDDNPGSDDFAARLDTNANGRVDELFGHGTFMAGLIHHIAPGCQILPVRVLDSDGVGNTFSVAAGILYAIDHGANIINLSLSSPVYSLPIRDAVDQALSAGIVVVACVGNGGSMIPQFPAAYPGVVAVAACDAQDRRMSTSDFGPYIKFSAPGDKIVSTFPDNQFARSSGTSASAALVTGSIARTHSRLHAAPAGFAADVLFNNSARIDSLNRSHIGLLGRSLRLGSTAIPIAPTGIRVR